VSLAEAVRIALRGLRANQLRSLLTTLGIMIGVAAVILLVALGNMASALILGTIEGLGSNVIGVIAGAAPAPGRPPGAGLAEGLSQEDVDELEGLISTSIAQVIPITTGTGTLLHGTEGVLTPITGATADYNSVISVDLAAGSFFNEGDVRTSAKVVVLGHTPVEELFGGDPAAALGETIKIERQAFRVVGVLAPGVGEGLVGDADNTALMPVTTSWNYLFGSGGREVSQILIQATSADTVTAAENDVQRILTESRGIEDADDADFTVVSQQDLLEQIGLVTRILTAFLGAIAAISLVVGGIGIMNIMLVTVTERTREIGIRKAIGAKRRAILLQFMLEAVVLSGVGGLLGVPVGVGLSELGAAAAAAQLGGDNLPARPVSISSMLLALGVSVSIGLFFGVYPANRAAKLRPIEALRHQ